MSKIFDQGPLIVLLLAAVASARSCWTEIPPGRRVAALGMGVGFVSGRQRRVPGGRTEVLKIKLTPEELQDVRQRAADLGVSPQRLMVDSTLSPIGLTVSERHGLWAELDRISTVLGPLGNNVNQIARALNAGERASLGSVIGTSAKVAEVAGRLKVVLDQVSPPTQRPAVRTKSSP